MYAQVKENGQVSCVFEFDSKPDGDFIEMPQNLNGSNAFEYRYDKEIKEFVHIGAAPSFYHFVGQSGKWVVNREYALSDIKNYISIISQKERQEPVYFNGQSFNADAVAVFNIHSAILEGKESYRWRAFDNTFVELSLEDMKKLFIEIKNRENAINQEVWKLKDEAKDMSDDSLISLAQKLFLKSQEK